MRAERVEARGIKSAGALFKGLNESGLPSGISSELYYHEKAHADADEEGKGEFGFYISGGWIVAYYLIYGKRTPEQLMQIAKAPGFANMSSKDWEIYNKAWREFLREQQEKNYVQDAQRHEIREILVEKLTAKLEELTERQSFPGLKELLGFEFSELIDKYGQIIYQAYRDAVEEIRFEIKTLGKDEHAELEVSDESLD